MTTGHRTDWAPLDDRLRALLAIEPPLSYSTIARELAAEFDIYVTKNSCIGRARRIGSPLRAPARKPTPRPITLAAMPKRHRAQPPPQPPPEPEPRPEPGKLRIEQLAPDDCRWPLNNGDPFLFCGEPRTTSRPYCAKHTRIAYQPVRAHR